MYTQASNSVSDGYHRNLSTALADMYQRQIGSFLAGVFDRLSGNNLDLITLLHMHTNWTENRPGDLSLLRAFVSLCKARTVAELPALMHQVNVISVLGDHDRSSFRPAHEFPLFSQIAAMMDNIKVTC